MTASAITRIGRPETWLALRSRAKAASSESDCFSIRIPFARSIAFRAASASASDVDLVAHRGELAEARLGGGDRRQQVVLAERLREVAEDAGVRCARHEAPLGERTHDHDRDRPLVEHPARRFDAVEPRHLHVEHREVGLLGACAARAPPARRAPRRRRRIPHARASPSGRGGSASRLHRRELSRRGRRFSSARTSIGCTSTPPSSVRSMRNGGHSLPLGERTEIDDGSQRLLAHGTPRREQLGMTHDRSADRGHEVALLERLHEIREHAGGDRLLDDRAIGERREHHDRDRPLRVHPPRRLDPVEPSACACRAARHRDATCARARPPPPRRSPPRRRSVRASRGSRAGRGG